MEIKKLLQKSEEQLLNVDELINELDKKDCNIELNKQYIEHWKDIKSKKIQADKDFFDYTIHLNSIDTDTIRSRNELTEQERQKFDELERKYYDLDDKLTKMYYNYSTLRLACSKKGKKIQFRSLK